MSRRPALPRPALSAFVAVALLARATGCGAVKRAAYAGFGRDAWQQPDRVVEVLGIEPGSRVAYFERIASEMQRAGLRRVNHHTWLSRRSFQVFTRSEE